MSYIFQNSESEAPAGKLPGDKIPLDKLLFALALAVLVFGIIRLGIGTIAGRVQARPVVVFSHWWENHLGEETLLELKKEFENLHEGIIVVFENRTYDELRQDLFSFVPKTDEAENTEAPVSPAGDVFALDLLWVPELVQNGLIEKNHTIPILSFMNVLYYNIDILRRAGFTRPPGNRSEFLDYARTAVDRGNSRWGISMDPDSYRGIYNDIFPWIWSAGAELVRDGSPAANSRQLIDSLTFLSALNNERLIASGQKLEHFISGRAAFMIASEGYIKNVREGMGSDSFSITAVPVPDNYSGRTFYSSVRWSAGVSRISNKKEEARLFAEFLAEKAPLLSEKAGAISASSIPRPGLDPHYSKIWDMALDAEIAEELDNFPWAPLREIFGEELDSLFAGESTPAGTAAAVQRRWLQAAAAN